MTQSRLILILIGLVILAGAFSIFTVNERERAIKFQLGKIVRADYEPGLHWKIPLVENVSRFDARIQTLDAEPEPYLTSEKKNVLVDSFVKWRVADVERFYTATGGSLVRASSRLYSLNQADIKDAFGKRTIAEVVAEDRAEIMRSLTESLSIKAAELGIEVTDVRVKRIDLPPDVSQSVYARMNSERKEVAKDLRSRGEEEAKKIRARAERERDVLLAEANRDAERVRGEGDGIAAEIYAETFGRNPEFYRLYRSLKAYESVFRDKTDVLLLEPDSEFFRYFKDSAGATN
jgi:membrane protease subunit HflC